MKRILQDLIFFKNKTDGVYNMAGYEWKITRFHFLQKI